MGGSKCKVLTCKNSQQKTKGDPLEKISYHRFPKDTNLRNEWIKRVCKDKAFSENAVYYVCSDHFTSDDFERDLRSELLKIPSRPKLKPNAIPSLLLEQNDNGGSLKQSCDSCTKLQKKLDVILKENEHLKEQLAKYNKTVDLPIKRKRGFIIWNPESPSSVSRIVQKWKSQQGTS